MCFKPFYVLRCNYTQWCVIANLIICHLKNLTSFNFQDIIISENVWSWKAISPPGDHLVQPTCSKLVQQDQFGQNSVQLSFKYLQSWRVHRCFQCPITVRFFFSLCLNGIYCSSVCPHCFLSSHCMLQRKVPSSLLLPPHLVFICLPDMQEAYWDGPFLYLEKVIL